MNHIFSLIITAYLAGKVFRHRHQLRAKFVQRFPTRPGMANSLFTCLGLLIAVFTTCIFIDAIIGLLTVEEIRAGMAKLIGQRKPTS